MNLEIIAVPAFKDNYIWLLVNHGNHCAVCIDPGDADPVIDTLEQQGLTLSAILVTHHHWDHTNGVKKLANKGQVPVYGPKEEAIPALTHPLLDQDTLELPDLQLQLTILNTPGHTAGHISYYGHGLLFCGDTLFAAGCGRIFDGSAKQLYHSLNKLRDLPEDTLVYCAHEYTEHNLQFALAVEPNNQDIQKRLTRIRELRRELKRTIPDHLQIELLTNPFLRCHIDSVHQAAEVYTGKTLHSPLEVFTALRSWKNQF